MFWWGLLGLGLLGLLLNFVSTCTTRNLCITQFIQNYLFFYLTISLSENNTITYPFIIPEPWIDMPQVGHNIVKLIWVVWWRKSKFYSIKRVLYKVQNCHVIYIYFVKLQSILKVLSNKFATVSRSKRRFNLNCQLLQTLWCIPHWNNDNLL